MATVSDETKPPHEDSSNAVVPAASKINLLNILIVAGVGYALKTGKLLNWIRKPWDLLQDLEEYSYTTHEDELRHGKESHMVDKEYYKQCIGECEQHRRARSKQYTRETKLVQKKHSRWYLGLHKYSGTTYLKGFKGIGETYNAETYMGFRQRSFSHSPKSDQLDN